MKLATLYREDPQSLVDRLNYAEKIERSKELIARAVEHFGRRMVVAHSLGKDSLVVWHLVKQVAPAAKGFIVTTRFKPPETVAFMKEEVARYPELQVFKNDEEVPRGLHKTDPDRCCDLLKVQPVSWALEQLEARCWVTGLRCTEGRTRTEYAEWEEREQGLVKLNPILIWHEREIWQYLALNQVPTNPLYAKGYRSLGCAPCTNLSAGGEERSGRWIGTSKCGGECGIHTRSLLHPDDGHLSEVGADVHRGWRHGPEKG